MNSSLCLEFFLRLTRFFTNLVLVVIMAHIFALVMMIHLLLVVITAHIFALVITVNLFLFVLSNVFPVGNVFNV